MNQMRKEYVYQAALAGLLHDVGKVVQRASDDPTRPPEGHEKTGQPVHAAFSQYFIDYQVPEPYRKYALHGVFHHNPQANEAEDKSLSTLIALADKLSSGERADYAEDKSTMQIVSIFDRVAIDRKRKKQDFHYLPLKPLQLNEETILHRETLTKEDQRNAYSSLREGLEKVAKKEK